MPTANTRSVLSGMRVREAMRRQVVALAGTESIDAGIRRLIKYKADALLVVDADHKPTGIVSKTDMIGAYYAGLPVNTPLEAVMVGPLLTGYLDDALDAALETMRSNRIHQLFVVGAQADRYEGVLNYADILGLVFQICRHCRKSRLRPPDAGQGGEPPSDSTVDEVMTSQVITSRVADNLYAVVEALTTHRMSAVLVVDDGGRPVGVISKTNLVLAWHRGVDPDTPAAGVMSRPVVFCDRRDPIDQALTTMLLSDLGRIFVHDGDSRTMVGVLSLSDAANHRSGTCRACVSSRMVA
jgi:CBS domain-containing protein